MKQSTRYKILKSTNTVQAGDKIYWTLESINRRTHSETTCYSTVLGTIVLSNTKFVGMTVSSIMNDFQGAGVAVKEVRRKSKKSNHKKSKWL